MILLPNNVINYCRTSRMELNLSSHPFTGNYIHTDPIHLIAWFMHSAVHLSRFLSVQPTIQSAIYLTTYKQVQRTVLQRIR
jgi:hypothetical protein